MGDLAIGPGLALDLIWSGGLAVTPVDVVLTGCREPEYSERSGTGVIVPAFTVRFQKRGLAGNGALRV